MNEKQKKHISLGIIGGALLLGYVLGRLKGYNIGYCDAYNDRDDMTINAITDIISSCSQKIQTA